MRNVTLIFGLLHGLGFAGALSEIYLPRHAIPLALFFFNVGVETGQLLFVAAVLLMAVIFRRFKIQMPGWTYSVPPYIVGYIAMFWVIERVAGFLPKEKGFEMLPDHAVGVRYFLTSYE